MVAVVAAVVVVVDVGDDVAEVWDRPGALFPCEATVGVGGTVVLVVVGETGETGEVGKVVVSGPPGFPWAELLGVAAHAARETAQTRPPTTTDPRRGLSVGIDDPRLPSPKTLRQDTLVAECTGAGRDSRHVACDVPVGAVRRPLGGTRWILRTNTNFLRSNTNLTARRSPRWFSQVHAEVTFLWPFVYLAVEFGC